MWTYSIYIFCVVVSEPLPSPSSTDFWYLLFTHFQGFGISKYLGHGTEVMKQLGKIYFVQNEPNFSALKILENVSKNSVLWIRIPHLKYFHSNPQKRNADQDCIFSKFAFKKKKIFYKTGTFFLLITNYFQKILRKV